jgi:lysophospholipase L1-like esterase
MPQKILGGGLTGKIGTRVVRLGDVASGDPSMNPDDVRYKLRFLGEGDSWFSINAFPWAANVLEQLQFSRPSIVLTLAEPGDTIRRMATLSKNRLLTMYLAHRNFASKWDAVFFSGGGNDLIDAAGSIIIRGTGTDPNSYVDAGALKSTLDVIKSEYRRIVDLRDRSGSPNKGCPIVIHTYDYATPRNAPAQFFGLPALGPWLHRALKLAGVTSSKLQQDVSDRLFNAMADTLLTLGEELPHFFVVDTRNTLERASSDATGNDKDWLNEIHPNADGYRKIAARIVRAL